MMDTVSRPKVSVLINNYNYGQYVGKAISSVLAQTLAGVECVVVDDGSTDNSREVIESFDNIKTIFKKNGGQTSAIRAGLSLCESDIVVLLDSDDTLYPEASSVITSEWGPNRSLVQYRLDIIDIAGHKRGEYPLKPFIRHHHSAYVRKWGELPSSPTSGNAFSRNLLVECLDLVSDAELSFVDGYLICAASFFGTIHSINKSLGSYLVHGKNASTSASQTLGRICAQVRVNIEQKQALCRFLAARGVPGIDFKHMLAPYHWRSMAFVKRGYPDIGDFREFSLTECRIRGIGRFTTFPDIRVDRRLRNILALVLLPFIPSRLIRSKIPL